jgi:hypothetical protein
MWDLPSQMKEKLLKQSTDAAHRAIRHYLKNEFDQFFIQVGISFELLGKARLATIHPSLIIDRDFDSLLHACAAGKHSKRLPGRLRPSQLRRDRRLNSGGRALSSGLQTPEGVLGVLASESTRRLLFATRNGTPWDQNLFTQTKGQATASSARYPGATRQWFPRFPSCERNSDEQFRGIAEIASTEARAR